MISFMPLQALEVRQPLLITEVMAGTSKVPHPQDPLREIGGGSSEYVEIYNPNNTDYALICFELQYAAKLDDAGSPNWGNSKVVFNDAHILPARSFALLATDDFIEQEYPEFDISAGAEHEARFAVMSSGLVAEDRSLRLIERNQVATESEPVVHCGTEITVHDALGWGENAPYTEGEEPAASITADHSLKRRVNEDGYFIDTNINGDHNIDGTTVLGDFQLSSTPEYLTLPEPEEDLEPTPPPTTEPPINESPDPPSQAYQSVVISELFIDPASPLRDADDEFVELYNPHPAALDLDGYVIQTGSRLQYRFEITDVVVPAGGYIAFESRESGLVLANSGGKVQVLAPDGSIAGQMVVYDKAPSNQSWARFNGTYAWTKVTTPGHTNKKDTPAVATSAKKVVAKTAPKRTYAKILITELLPDPASPKLDKNDEFVELYNPNTSAVNLSGYKLKTGKSLSTTQMLENIVLQPGQYIALFSIDTKMSLGNKSGQAQLLDPNGDVVSSTEPYTEADEDMSWAWIAGKWQWTAQASPAAKNTLVAATQADKEGNKDSATSVLSATTNNALAQPATIPLEQANLSVVAAAGAAAILYGIYEFRYDISNRIHQYRRHLIARRKDS